MEQTLSETSVDRTHNVESPVSGGDIASEYVAVRERVGLVDRSRRGKVSVTGSDRVRFLHGMLSNTVEGLPPGSWNHACLTTPRGQTLADLFVHHLEGALLLEMEAGLEEKVSGSLDKFLIADDVEMREVTEDYSILGVHGPESADLVSRLLNLDAAGIDSFRIVEAAFENFNVRIASVSYAGEAGYDLWIESPARESLSRALVAAGARPVGDEALETLRVEAGVPVYGRDVDESSMPLEAGLTHTVDFTKGCFVGQEALAKMQNLGKPRRYLVGLKVESDSAVSPGTKIHDEDKEIGRLTTSVRHPVSGEIIALASVRRGFQEPGRSLLLDGEIPAIVAALPFVPMKNASKES